MAQRLTEEETFTVIGESVIANEPDAADEMLMHFADDLVKIIADELVKAGGFASAVLV